MPDAPLRASASCAQDRRERQSAAPTVLRGEVRDHARARELLILTKANSTATVHRGTYLDYVGVKSFGPHGEVTGEHRFLGLWTSTAYYSSPRDIPVLRQKVQRVIDHFALDPASHDAKAVLNVLETYPRDELFQASVPDLIRIVRGVVNLYERRTVRLLARRDPYHRFYSCLIYVPRDRYNTEVRQRIEQIVLEGFEGKHVEIAGADLGFESRAPARRGAHGSERPSQGRLRRHREAHRARRDHLERSAAHACSCRAQDEASALALAQPLSAALSRWPTKKTWSRPTRSKISRTSKRCAPQPQALRLNLLSPARSRSPSACT